MQLLEIISYQNLISFLLKYEKQYLHFFYPFQTIIFTGSRRLKKILWQQNKNTGTSIYLGIIFHYVYSSQVFELDLLTCHGYHFHQYRWPNFTSKCITLQHQLWNKPHYIKDPHVYWGHAWWHVTKEKSTLQVLNRLRTILFTIKNIYSFIKILKNVKALLLVASIGAENRSALYRGIF